MPPEKATYYSYRTGRDPESLRLGSLVFDLKNPTSIHGRYAHEADVKDEWIETTPFEPLTYELKPGWAFNIGAKLDDDLRFSVGGDNADQVVVTAPRAQRKEIRDKKWFFENHVLANEKTLAWLKKCISIGRFMYLMNKMTLQNPSIWLLTGVYVLEDAKCGTLKIKKGHVGVEISLPVVSRALAGLNPGISVDVNNDSSIKCEPTIPGSYVWAGQWVRLKIRFLPRNRAIDPNEIGLEELRDFGGPLRAPGDVQDLGCVVKLSIDDGLDGNDFTETGAVGNLDDTYEQNFWGSFEEEWANWE